MVVVVALSVWCGKIRVGSYYFSFSVFFCWVAIGDGDMRLLQPLMLPWVRYFCISILLLLLLWDALENGNGKSKYHITRVSSVSIQSLFFLHHLADCVIVVVVIFFLFFFAFSSVPFSFCQSSLFLFGLWG